MRNISLLALTLGLAIFLSSGSTFSEDAKGKGNASKFVQDWLSLVDSGSYSQTWNDLSDVYQSSLTKDDWVNSLNSYHKSLGKLTKRKQQYVTKSSDPSIGDYLIFQYQSSFEKKKLVNEAVSVIKGRDGNWKILGYSLFQVFMFKQLTFGILTQRVNQTGRNSAVHVKLCGLRWSIGPLVTRTVMIPSTVLATTSHF